VLRFLADENFNRDIVEGLLQRELDLDIVCAQDVGLTSTPDRTILAWAAQEDRILLTHDVETITKFAYDRVRIGQPMPSVFEVSSKVPLRTAIEDILLIAQGSIEGEWEGQVRYLPLR
jgi:predicted nuclease of predicted toxin-antitoxin system